MGEAGWIFFMGECKYMLSGWGEWTTFMNWWGWVEVDRSIFWVGGG